MCVCGIGDREAASSLMPSMNASLGASTQDPSGTMFTPLMLQDKEQFNW